MRPFVDLLQGGRISEKLALAVFVLRAAKNGFQ